MSTLAKEIERKTELIIPIERNTASGSVYNSEGFQQSSRRETEQLYSFWLRNSLPEGIDLPSFSTFLPEFLISSDPDQQSKFSCGRLLLFLETEDLAKAFPLRDSSRDTLKEISEIIQKRNQLLSHDYVDETGYTEGPPDEYFTEGIYIDLKYAFESHEELNRLREKYGIRRV